MNRLTLLWAALLTLGLQSCDSGRHIDSYFGLSIPSDSVDCYLEAQMQAHNIPGMSVAIVNEGEVVHHQHFGYANVEAGIPVSDATIFEGASMSKSVFGMFAMQFVEQGLLDLDQPLHEYLPYLDIAHDERYKKITARMVLSHRSGFPNWRESEPDEQLSIHFEPGTDYCYSGEGYQYLAMVLAELAHTDWEGLEARFQQQIAQPLGMQHTEFVPSEILLQHKAEPYNEHGEHIDWENDYWTQKEAGVFGAGYSIHSNALDFSRWMIGVMNEQLLNEASYAELLKPHSVVPSDAVDISYTLGFMQYPWPFTNTYGHGGDNDGFTCFYSLNTEKDWGFVLFTNSEYGQELGEELFFYLLIGPNRAPVVVLGVVVLLSILVGLALLIRLVLRRLKTRA